MVRVLFSCILIPVAGVAYEFEQVFRDPAFDLQDFLPDARAEGLGGAFVAVAEGSAGAWWNAGALPAGQTIEIGYLWTELPDLAFVVRGRQYTNFSLAAEYRHFRLGFSQGRYMSDPFTVRTPFDPEGSSTRIDQSQSQVGLSFDLAHYLLAAHPHLCLGFGLNYKHLSEEVLGEKFSGDDLDVGMLLSWRHDLGGTSEGSGFLDFRGGVGLVNLTDATVSFEGNDNESHATGFRLGQRLRCGVACVGAILPGAVLPGPDPPGFRQSYLLRWTLAADGEEMIGAAGATRDFQSRIGAEAKIGEIISLRVGYRDAAGQEGWGYGAGLGSDLGFAPAGVRFDYARVPSASNIFVGEDEEEDRYSVTAWAKF